MPAANVVGGWFGQAARVFVAGHGGMVGSALCKIFKDADEVELLTASRAELDLRRRDQVDAFLAKTRPDIVVVAAATVGGIHANHHRPAEFIYDNLQIAANLIDGAYRAGIDKLLYLGSSCIYPRMAVQPMAESALLTGHLEPTNEPYAVAKIAGIKLCESYNRQYGVDYRCVMPTNLYGPGDNFDLHQGHVIPALMRRIHMAKQQRAASVAVWGTGRARREFLYVDDLAHGCMVVMASPRARLAELTTPQQAHINVGFGQDISIAELARKIAATVAFEGMLDFQTNRPDGTPRKLLDVTKIKQLGWEPKIMLEDGLQRTYRWFVAAGQAARGIVRDGSS